MATQATIQAAIWKGYAHAAKPLGANFDFTRPVGTPMPLGLEGGGNLELEDNSGSITTESNGSWQYPGTSLFTRLVSLNAEDMTYKKPNKYGKATWYALFDGTGVNVGDYFTNTDLGTFFVAAMQPLLPIYVVECNRTISIYRPPDDNNAGDQPYSGMTDANRQNVTNAMPCSILQGTKGEKSDSGLPADTRSPWWTILLPNWGTILQTDTLIDDLGQRYTVSSNECSDLGFRLTCMTTMA